MCAASSFMLLSCNSAFHGQPFPELRKCIYLDKTDYCLISFVLPCILWNLKYVEKKGGKYKNMKKMKKNVAESYEINTQESILSSEGL